MTLTTILADCYRRLNFEGTPATAVSTRLTAFVNEAHRRILGTPGLESLRRETVSFPSVASTSTYALPQAVSRILSIYETTNDLRLQERGVQWYHENLPDTATTTGTPEIYVPLGYTAVAAQPSAAAQLLVDSTSASDTGTAYIEVIRTGGYRGAYSVAMTGTTAVNLGPSDTIAVTKFYLSAAAAGTVTLVQTAEGGTVLSTIPIGGAVGKYWEIALWPTPAAAVTYYVDAEIEIPDMANAGDEPRLPSDWHWLVATGARMMEYEKQDDSRFMSARQEFERGLRDLRWRMMAQPCAVVAANPVRRVGSRLGPWYPAGS